AMDRHGEALYGLETCGAHSAGPVLSLPSSGGQDYRALPGLGAIDALAKAVRALTIERNEGRRNAPWTPAPAVITTSMPAGSAIPSLSGAGRRARSTGTRPRKRGSTPRPVSMATGPPTAS